MLIGILFLAGSPLPAVVYHALCDIVLCAKSSVITSTVITVLRGDAFNINLGTRVAWGDINYLDASGTKRTGRMMHKQKEGDPVRVMNFRQTQK